MHSPSLYWPRRERAEALLQVDEDLPELDVTRCRLRDVLRSNLSDNSDIDRVTAALQRTSRIDVAFLLEAHRLTLGRSQKSGFRRDWALVGVSSHDAHGFVAPVSDFKAELKWILGMLSPDRSGLGALAAFAYFFLHLHPFADGNGRVMRYATLALPSVLNRPLLLPSFTRVVATIQADKGAFVASLHSERIFGHGLINFIKSSCTGDQLGNSLLQQPSNAMENARRE